MMSYSEEVRKGDTQCAVRCLFRENVRYHLKRSGHESMAVSIFTTTSQHEDQVIRQSPAFNSFRSILVKVQKEHESKFQDLVEELNRFQGSPEKSFQLYLTIANRLWKEPNFGRVASLIAFSGFALTRLADKGEEFVKAVVGRVEDDVAKRVNNVLQQQGLSTSYARASTMERSILSLWDWTAPFKPLGLGETIGFAAVAAGSAAVIAAAVAQS